MSHSENTPRNFIRTIIDHDIRSGKNGKRVATRFPPEPNGYLHIGHAKSICLNFGIAEDYSGSCNLRFDDTNPARESQEFIDAIRQDIEWLGFTWNGLCQASNYFEQLYGYAEELIEKGLAYVDSQSAEDIRTHRGTLTETGKDSPDRDRAIDENLEVFRGMRAGEYADGEWVLRAKIDMQSPNINMRDPILYRIRRLFHHNTGDAWCIYPMYDFTHCISDAIESITHSLCTLEFEDHRPLYDWVLDHISIDCHPQQIEFSRLEMLYTVTSKRKLSQLVVHDHVDGWDDPRMPTVSGMRRRGFTAASIRDFCARAGVAKSQNRMQMSELENSVRWDLENKAPRVMAVLDPIKVVITNWPEDRCDEMECPNHPKIPELGTRIVPFTRELYIDREDFMEDPPSKYFRLKPGGTVRLKYGYIIDYQDVVRDENGMVVEIHCSYDPATRSGQDNSGRKVKGVIQWVSATHGITAPVRMYDRLFTRPLPADGKEGREFTDYLNPESLILKPNAVMESSLASANPEDRFQFERLGYFVADRHDSKAGAPVFNRIVSLRDSWGKLEQQHGA